MLFFHKWGDAPTLPPPTPPPPPQIFKFFSYLKTNSFTSQSHNGAEYFVDIEHLTIHITFPVKLQPIKLQLLSILLKWWRLSHSEFLKIKSRN